MLQCYKQSANCNARKEKFILRWKSSLALFSNIKGSRRRRLPLMFEKSAKLDCHLKVHNWHNIKGARLHNIKREAAKNLIGLLARKASQLANQTFSGLIFAVV